MSDLPSFNLNRILQLRDQLLLEVFYPRLQVTIEEDVFRSTVTDLRQKLPRDISAETVYESARQLLGQILTPQLALSTAWRIAGNVHRMKQGLIPHPWNGQSADEWVPVQVARIELARSRYGDPGAKMTLQVLAGSSCPLRMTKFWKRGLMGAMAQRIGFTPSWGKRPFTDVAQFVNLRFLVLVEAARSTLEEPGYFEIGVTGQLEKWNLDILKRRFKVIPCPNGWSHECHTCAQGYEACPAATHAKTYVPQFCADCARQAQFDPESPSLYCVTCTHKNSLKRVRT